MSRISPSEFDPRTYAIIGAAFEVHRVLGGGFLERPYQLAFAAELRRRNIPFEREVNLPIPYKGEVLDCTYRIDFVCYGDVLVELKAQVSTGSAEEAQVLNYLRASTMDIALLVNFSPKSLEFRRFTMAAQAAFSEASPESVKSPDSVKSVQSVVRNDLT